MKIKESELILNPDGSVYHINLLPEDIADTIITVGDPDRVPEVSKHFDSIEIKKQKREFVTHTGYIGKKRISVISTGIGTGNIDIVLNELDALVNIDLKTRTIKPEIKQLDIIRLGTSGGLHEFTPVDSIVISEYGIGLDALGTFYKLNNSDAEQNLRTTFLQHFHNNPTITHCYVASGAPSLVNRIADDTTFQGITVTCGGFYGPQGRVLRAIPKVPDLIDQLQQLDWQGHPVINFEMETAGIYAMGNLLGHNCCSVSTIVANRAAKQFSPNPAASVENLLRHVLGKIV